MSGNGNGNGNNGGTTGNGGNTGNIGDGGSGPSLQQTLETTTALLQAGLDAGMSGKEALEASRPQAWNS
ncbi:hypothetical protein GWI34_16395 [Actinomadura sp. DSM 109109]|nr:hypothetical protein [Actinomadura lepetitiana]